jgi:DHA3 family macrolide efflux protein-like MFS transporter
MILSLWLTGLEQILMGVVPNFWLYLVVKAMTGVSLPIFNTPAITLVQEKVAKEYLGRVFGVLSMISSGVMPLAILFFGPLSDHLSIEWQLIGTGILLVVQAVFLRKNRLLVEGSLPSPC